MIMDYESYVRELRKYVDELDDALALHGLPPVDKSGDALMAIFKTMTHILHLLPERKKTTH